MGVAESISGALVRFGRPMILRRLAQAPGAALVPTDVSVYGTAKNYAPDQLVGAIIQGDTEVTLTNKEIAAAQWPGPPQKDDKIIIDGRQRNVMAVEPKYLGTEVLVYILQVRG